MRSWPQDVQVAPSILSSDFGRVREQVTEVMEAGARVIHVDVMDGHFVPVITFGPKMLADIADVIHEHDGFADVHLMIEQPERHLAQFAEAGADSITVHVETCPHLHHTLQLIHELGCRAGVTLNPATPVEAIAEAARYADVLLCMSVNPGWGGQTFIPATLDRLPRMRALASRARGRRVEVDGGIHEATIADAHARRREHPGCRARRIFGAASPGGGLPRPGRPGGGGRRAHAPVIDAPTGPPGAVPRAGRARPPHRGAQPGGRGGRHARRRGARGGLARAAGRRPRRGRGAARRR